MAFDEHLADRINIHLEKKGVPYKEKKMFGGLCFMVDEKMCMGIVGDAVMLRIDPEEEETLKSMHGISDMTFTGKPMKGYLYASPEAVDNEESLGYYLDRALEFNPRAKASKKKKTKN